MKTGFCGEEREILIKGGSLLRERAAVKFRFIAAQKAHHSLTRLCPLLEGDATIASDSLV
jgi:hypothetical protein